jgi:hypothetical protein
MKNNNIESTQETHTKQSHLQTINWTTKRRLVIDVECNCYDVDVKYLGKQKFIKKLLGDGEINKLSDVFKLDKEH